LRPLTKLKFLGLAIERSRSPIESDSPGPASVSEDGKRKLQEAIPKLEIFGNAAKVDWPAFEEKLAKVRTGKSDALELYGPEVFHLDRIADLRNLKKLHLRRTLLDDRGLRHLRDLSGLEELWLYQTWITDDGLVHLKNLHNIKDLSVSSTRVTDEGLRHLAGLRNLEWLDLQDTPITGSGLRHLAACDRLERIDLGVSNFVSFDFPSVRLYPGVSRDGLEAICAFRGLRTLSLWGKRLADDDLAMLSTLTKLETLEIRGTGVRGFGLQHLQDLRGLHELTLWDNALTDEAVPFLAKLTQLTDLHLSGEDGLTEKALRRLRNALPRTCALHASFEVE
jgi:internalin A